MASGMDKALTSKANFFQLYKRRYDRAFLRFKRYFILLLPFGRVLSP